MVPIPSTITHPDPTMGDANIPTPEKPTPITIISLLNGKRLVSPVHEPSSSEEESKSISHVLGYCKQRIVFPYIRLLGVIGLKPFITDTSTDKCKLALIMNKMYILFVVLVLFLGYALQYLTCFRRDRGFAFRNDTEIFWFPMDSTAAWNRICPGNSIYVHIIPTILHYCSFLYMVFLYRLHDDEQLPNLIERVFLQASQSHTNYFAQKKPIRTFQLLVILSITWIVLSSACQLLQLTTHNCLIAYFKNISSDIKHGLVVLMAISNSWQDVIQVTVAVSYSVHCYLLTTYLNLIHARVQEHSITLAEAVKEIGELGKLLKYLNNELAPGLGPLLLLDASLAISGFIFIFNGGHPFELNMHIWDYVTVLMTSILWLALALFPIVQIAKLTTSCKQIREIGHFVRLRPFGYQDAPQEDLDSFLLFVSTLRMEVYILRIPISTQIISLVILFLLFGVSTWGLISN